MKTIGVVIPAYNEAGNLPCVLHTVCAVDWMAQIIIVDDGSEDDTSDVARRWAAVDQRITLLRLPYNQGKAAAMLAGASALSCELVLFLDADLIGLQPQHLDALIEPVVQGSCEMTVAVFRDGSFLTDAAHRASPYLSGQRCLCCLAAQTALHSLRHSRYGVEFGLTRYARQRGWRCRYVHWRGVTHVMKEQKLGFHAGLYFRWCMYSQILSVLLPIHLIEEWASNQPWQQWLPELALRPSAGRLLALLLVLLLAAFILDSGRLQARNEFRLQDLSDWAPGSYERILVFAPHPDDEVLAAGGMMRDILQAETPVTVQVVIVTNGDASRSTAVMNGYNPVSRKSYQQLAALRQKESLAALDTLGIAAENVAFWGFPDRGIEAIWQNYWQGERPYRSPFSGLQHTHQTRNSPENLPYNSEAVLQRLRETLADFQPDAIIMSHPQDGHPDHRALANFILLAVALNDSEGLSPLPDQFAYVMWLNKPLWPESVQLDQDVQRFPVRFSADTTDWVRFDLPDEAREEKALALKSYQSQARPLRGLMRSANGRNELFNRLWEHRIPRLTTVSATPDEQWQFVPYDYEWRRALIGWPFTSPVRLWSTADTTDLWLAAELPRSPQSGVSYRFRIHSVRDGQNISYLLPLTEHSSGSGGTVFLAGRLPLAQIEAVSEEKVFMASLEIRAPGRTTVARSGWYLLYLEEAP